MKRFSAGWIMLLSLLLWSCDNIGETTQPGLVPSPMVVTSTTGEQYVVAQELDPAAGSISADIGPAGGMLVLGNHVLTVSENAVSATTKFTIKRDYEYPLRVDLTATRETENDIGAAGFAAPVTLALSYDDVISVPNDASVMEVLYMRPDGLVEEVPSSVDVYENRVVATLSHFSPYALGWP